MSIVLSNASFGYGAEKTLADLNVAFQAYTMTAVLGSNGVGKSTLLKGILGLIPCLQGRVTIAAQLLSAMSPAERACQLAYLEQNAECHWPLTVQKVVELGRFPHRQQGSSSPDQDCEAIAAAMRMTDITAFAQRPVTKLSGGERARVMLARALAVNAPVLLADEPVAGFDPQHQLTVLTQLRDWAAKGCTVLVVLHDISLALLFCARVLLIMPDGTALEGSAAAILTPENIRKAFNISVIMGEHEQQPWLVPWQAEGGK